jgi:hypothetical protein
MTARNAALLFALLSAIVVLFQLALVCGTPWGEFTLGGRWRGRLPAEGRLIALLSIGILTFQSAVITARAGIAFPQLAPVSPPLAWAVVAFCVLGSIMNGISPSPRERMLWLPVVLCMLASSLVVATS